MTKTWIWSDELVLETRQEFGFAARRNRSHYSGRKVHRIHAEYVVGIVPGAVIRPGTFGATFQATGKPVLFSARPMCGVTDGQHAARPVSGFSEEKVTCSKCGPKA